jgi:hypothetical protein
MSVLQEEGITLIDISAEIDFMYNDAVNLADSPCLHCLFEIIPLANSRTYVLFFHLEGVGIYINLKPKFCPVDYTKDALRIDRTRKSETVVS